MAHHSNLLLSVVFQDHVTPAALEGVPVKEQTFVTSVPTYKWHHLWPVSINVPKALTKICTCVAIAPATVLIVQMNPHVYSVKTITSPLVAVLVASHVHLRHILTRILDHVTFVMRHVMSVVDPTQMTVPLVPQYTIHYKEVGVYSIPPVQ